MNKRESIKKRILSLFLALAVLLSSSAGGEPVNAYAADYTYDSSVNYERYSDTEGLSVSFTVASNSGSLNIIYWTIYLIHPDRFAGYSYNSSTHKLNDSGDMDLRYCNYAFKTDNTSFEKGKVSVATAATSELDLKNSGKRLSEVWNDGTDWVVVLGPYHNWSGTKYYNIDYYVGSREEITEQSGGVTPPVVETHTVTLEYSNLPNAEVVLMAYKTADGSNVYEKVIEVNGGSFELADDEFVKVFVMGYEGEITVTAEGASRSEILDAGVEGKYCIITDFTKDTSVVVNGQASGEVTPPAEEGKLTEAKAVVQGVVDAYKANNATTKEKIEALVEEALADAGLADVVVNVTITKTRATTSGAGKVTGIVEIGFGSESDTVEINKTIARIETNSGSSTPSYPSYPSATQTPVPTPTEAPTPTESPEVTGTPKPTKVPVPTMNPAEPTPEVMPNTGWLYIETGEDENAYAAEFGNTEEELEDSIPISQKEANAIAAGEEVIVYLEAEDISESVTEEDKVMVRETIEKVTEDRGFGLTRLGVYLDLNLYKKVGSNDPIRIINTKEDVKIVVKLPEELISKNSSRIRVYQIVRIHEGEVTVIDCEYDKEEQTLSFASDTFSTCAIIYTDMSEKRAEEIMQEESKQEGPKQEEKPVEKEEPKFKTYTVKKDDFLWKIAEEQLGDGSRYPEIKKASGITSNVLNVGQVLVIPVETEAEDEDSKPQEKEDAKPEEKEDVLPVGKKTYTVKKGDYLWKIAAEKLGDGRRYPEIMKLSGIEDTEILVGQVLTLPEK